MCLCTGVYMSREIKFKFWSREQKKFLEQGWDHYHVIDDEGDVRTVYESDCVREDFKDDVIPVQYTGLKDKNGKEIYEGSIVKDEWGDVGLVVYTDEDVESCGCCTQEFSGIGYVAIQSNGSYLYLHVCEVIGHVLENPELYVCE